MHTHPRRRRFRPLSVLVALVALALPLLVALATPAAAGPPTGGITTASTVRHYAPCATEDGPGPCVWDATVRGNGQGISYRLTDAAGSQSNLVDTPCTATQVTSNTGPCRLVTDQSGGYNARWLLRNGVQVATP